ncbi:MAG: hypothetical protein IKC15_01665, partial [Kiritimatiellae bacterium]|nr:hypothetical protein [Kiritimatiellia bacterium]
MLLSVIALLALTRAELVARMKAPVLTMAEGLVKVYADCPEDMRRDYQMPVARFAADVCETLYRGAGERPRRFADPGIVIHIGSVRTNLTEVTARVETNAERVVTRIYAKSPGYADQARLRLELTKAFGRAVLGRELSDRDAVEALVAADPKVRVRERRRELEEWLRGEGGHDDEEALALMRKVLEPGVASERDVLVFASRLQLYPETFDRPFVGGRTSLSFREAIDAAGKDPRVRLAAYLKSNELAVFGGGRGEGLARAAESYTLFLRELVRGKMSQSELSAML